MTVSKAANRFGRRRNRVSNSTQPGHYSDITKPNGVRTTLFTSGDARRLRVRIGEQAEQPRVLLVSVSYALKTGGVTTVGGLPPSACVFAVPLNGGAAASTVESATGQKVLLDTLVKQP